MKRLVCLFVVVALSSNATAVFSTAAGFGSSTVYSGTGSLQSIFGGLDFDGGNLYVGQGTDLVTIDVSDNSTLVSGTLPGAVANSLIALYNGITYTSYADTF